MRAKLERRASELGVSDRVRFLGAIRPRELGAVYEGAEMLVVPAVSEASPLVAVEAMACGLPVVASRISGLPSLVKDWDTGFLVKPGDVGQLAMAMTFLWGDDSLRARMGQNGRHRVLRDFVWAAVARRYLDVYGSLAGLSANADDGVAIPQPSVALIDAEQTAVAV
jgi:glycosyltransferase involved in cell wall biosynthesis